MDLYKKPREELHFSVGEALSVVAAGWNSTASADPLLKTDVAAQVAESEAEPMRTIISKLLADYLFSDRVETRSPAAIWLLSLVKHTGAHPVIQRNLFDIQRAFSQLLGDNNEIIQEVGGKGLTVVYDIGTSANKQKLLDDLVKIIAEGKSGFKITANSELFPKGFLGQSPSGQNISTYKQICSIAEEMKDPELVYKFMSLASHNTLWNSKKGAAFAAQTLTTQLGGKNVLAPHLEKLVPKLYRGSFDPSYNVAQSMTRILESLISRKEANQTYFKPIIADLLENIWNNQWRTREASCSALSDLLTGKTMEEVYPYLPELWDRTFRVCDDSKDTVRAAAFGCLKTVGNVSTRLCDPTKTTAENGKKAIEIILPYLCKQGLMSQVEEISGFSVTCLLKILKQAGYLLKPHLSMLITTILGALTELESASLTYLQQHAEKLGVADKVESMRLSGDSIFSESFGSLIEQMDEHNIKEIVDSLLSLISTSVGLPTRVGACRFTTQICSTKPDLIKPFVPKFMERVKKAALTSKSAAVRQSYSQLLGFMCRLAAPKSVQKLLQSLKEVYGKSEADDVASRSVVGHTLFELSKTAASQLQPYYSEVVPLVFLARHEADKSAKKLFEDTWIEMGCSLSLYLKEIITEINSALGSESWTMKKQGATAISTLFSSVSISSIESYEEQLLAAITNNLKGRIWNGKEALLVALGTLVESSFPLFANNKDLFNRHTFIFALVLGECQKKDLTYKQQALHTLSLVLTTFIKVDDHFNVLPQLLESLKPFIEKLEEKEQDTAMTDDEKEERSQTPKKNKPCPLLHPPLQHLDQVGQEFINIKKKFQNHLFYFYANIFIMLVIHGH